MSIGKIIKTGLAIYGGAVLAKKLGQYIFVKNKDKIAAKVKEKIVKACDKAIDEVFKDTTPKKAYSFKASEIAAKVKEKIIKACDKAIDKVFKDTTPKKAYSFKASEIAFHTADDAYDIRQRMIDTIHERGKATVDDYKDLAAIAGLGFIWDSEDYKWGWTDPDIFESAPVERITWGSTYMYYLDVRHPDRLEGK